ncbi:hypothetical protein NUBL17186_48130 [Klebsiella quasipneumoniae]|nr:hypothetical protein NUBL13784_53140 [Klebsiella pneumoniae]GKO94200.1 hypothetical protein NUBL17186_48130 [Klebsiella quasipneumoniae]GKK07841.1 hypothetical protein NUBL21985_53860 [Klebsiella pneumoniae]GKK71630.1 hypothetical protein NUBL13795_52590 [Klebsiella pneumoniae]GKO05813.1 hypothetical protein MS5797_53770 [Klebsiella pneumoniae]
MSDPLTQGFHQNGLCKQPGFEGMERTLIPVIIFFCQGHTLSQTW